MVLGDTRLCRRHRVDETELVAMCQYETIRPKGVCVWKKPCAGKLGIESQNVFLSYCRLCLGRVVVIRVMCIELA